MKKPKLTIFTCFHERTELSRLWLKNMKGLAKHFAKSAELRIVVAVTEGDAQSIALCKEYSDFPLTYQECPNNPVGLKWNFALNLALRHDADYYVKADDDGMVTRPGFARMLSMMAQGHPYIGFRGELFVDAEHGEASHFQYENSQKCMGTFKALSASAVETAVLWVQVEHLQKLSLDYLIHEPGDRSWMPARMAGYFVGEGIVQAVTDKGGNIKTRINLWERWDRNLDWCSDARLAMQGIICSTLTSDTPMLLNVKLADKNIWPFSFRGPEGKPYDYEKIKDLLTGSDWHNLTQLRAQYKKSPTSPKPMEVVP